jgi:hypothetical protein
MRKPIRDSGLRRASVHFHPQWAVGTPTRLFRMVIFTGCCASSGFFEHGSLVADLAGRAKMESGAAILLKVIRQAVRRNADHGSGRPFLPEMRIVSRRQRSRGPIVVVRRLFSVGREERDVVTVRP